MVDFNAEKTVGTPAVDVVRILVLQARANVFDSLEKYNKDCSNNIDASQAVLKSRIATWFLEIQAYLKRTNKAKEYSKTYESWEQKLFFNENILEKKEILSIIFELNKVLDELKIIRLDNRPAYDRTNIELDNEINELT